MAGAAFLLTAASQHAGLFANFAGLRDERSTSAGTGGFATALGLPDDRLDLLPPLYFRAAWKAAVANQYEQRSRAEFTGEVALVSLWFFSTGAYETADPGLLKAGWPALLRRQKAWSLAQAPEASARSSSASDEWNP